MLEPTHDTTLSSHSSKPRRLAKWPADDDDAPSPGGGVPAGAGGNYNFDPGDGNFKKGAIKPIGIVIALLAVIGLGAFLLIGTKKEAEKIPVDKAAEIKKQLLILPKADQMPKWREYAAGQSSSYLKEEALKQLAWAHDPEGVRLATMALTDIQQTIRAQAARALAEYGSPAADTSKDALLKALKEAGKESKPQIGWTLVVLNEKRAIKDVMDMYRAGFLSTVLKLDDSVAFDPNLLVQLIGIDQLATMYGDPSPAVRQLVATVLSRHAQPAYTDALIALLKDEDQEISRQAAPGLGKIGDQRARDPLLEKLKTADADNRTKYLEALRNGIGTKGLLLALGSISQDDRSRWWFRTKQVFDMVRKVADPSGADDLLAYINGDNHIHWQTIAAFALAEVGDVRAVPMLAKRMRMDALKIYSDETDYEMMLKRNNNERVVAARMIADLGVLHPDKREQIRNQAEDAIIFWLHEMPSPHANGMRALAAMDSKKDIDALRKWANPTAKLPLEGQQPPMPEEWVIAQSAMRYVGWMKDEQSYSVLEKALTRRDKDLDVTMDGLMQGGLAILGMTLRALGVGAAQGMSEWGDNKGFTPLMKYIEEPKENEQSRMEACAALAWVATEKDMQEVVDKIKKYDKGDPKDEFRRTCLLETLITRPIPGTAPVLMELLNENSSLSTRHQVARALGKMGFDKDIEAKLFDLMKNEALMVDGTLALALGATPETAARAIAMWADKPKEALEELQDLWFKSFGYWSNEDLDQGNIFRYVDNAEAISHVELKDTPQEWAPVLLTRQFDNLEFDNGPHSFTRVVLRYRLKQMAEGTDPAKQSGAIRTLKFMKEQGVLLTLRDAPGEAGKLASAAYHELMNPKTVKGGVIQTAEETQAEETGE